MSRIEKKTPETLNQAQRAAYDRVIANRSPEHVTPAQKEAYKSILGTTDQKFNLGGPFSGLLSSPELAIQVSDLAKFMRFGTTLSPRWVELAIITTARFWTAQYEWYAHAGFARTAGVEDHIIQSIKANQRPDFADPNDATVYDACHELHHDHQMSDETYQRATDLLGEQGLIELIGVIGFYTLVSMTLNTIQVPVPEGEELPPA